MTEFSFLVELKCEHTIPVVTRTGHVWSGVEMTSYPWHKTQLNNSSNNPTCFDILCSDTVTLIYFHVCLKRTNTFLSLEYLKAKQGGTFLLYKKKEFSICVCH